METLDVGCGSPSKWHSFLKTKNVIHVDINKSAYHLEVQCSAYNLPFKPDIFNSVYLRHILEHLIKPVDAIQEAYRVSKHMVIIKVPNGSFYKARESAKGHIYSWTEWTLQNLLELYFGKVTVILSNRWVFSTVPIRKIQKIKLMIERTLFGKFQELTAICLKR